MQFWKGAIWGAFLDGCKKFGRVQIWMGAKLDGCKFGRVQVWIGASLDGCKFGRVQETNLDDTVQVTKQSSMYKELMPLTATHSQEWTTKVKVNETEIKERCSSHAADIQHQQNGCENALNQAN